MAMHATLYLEHFAEQFASNMLHRHGVSLDQYLADPGRYEHLLNAPFPLLKAQTRVRVRLAQQELLQEQAEQIADELDDLPRNNVRPFEPLRHHRFPKRRGVACAFRPSRPPKPQTV